MRERIPWWARIGVKLVLSRLPASYGLWQKLKLFRHGDMDHAGYALRVFRQHFVHSGLSVDQPFVALELGPGDSLSSAVIAAAHGAAHTWLVDVGDFASRDIHVYARIAEALRQENLASPDLSRVTSCAQLLSACRATYLTRGIASLREIPTASVDFIWSHAVLEHVRRHEFTDYLRETRRVLRPTGVSSHEVDLRDHLGGALNNLRLSSKVWEADWMTRSGFYTNRLSRKEIMAAFAAAGLDATVIREVRWDSLPTPVDKFAEEFRAGDAGERLVNIFDVIARPVG